MLRSVNQLYGDKLGASDGEIGHVKDFYFDDRDWAIRYVIADTGSWLAGRQVLISPHAIGRLDHSGRIVPVSLTRKQIEDSPSIASHLPVSRQFEEDYYRHYGWPTYWQGGKPWGLTSLPVPGFPVAPPIGPQHGRADAHLFSTQAVKGYQLGAKNGTIGHVCDFLVDPGSWVIQQLVVKTGHRFTGKEVQLSVCHVDRISYEESTLHVNVSTEEVEQGSAHETADTASTG